MNETRSKLAPVFEAVKHTLDAVAGFIELGVIFELHLAIPAGRDAGGRFGLVSPVAQVIGVISAISDDSTALGDIGFKALTRMGNIGSVARSQAQMNRKTGPIADQMQLAVQPAFGLADAAPARGVF